jgi:hypothetical protein
VFLKSGSGANDVLRSLAQSAEKLVDAIGNIPGPILQAGLNLTAIIGVSALVGGGFLAIVPKIKDARDAFSDIDDAGKRTTNTMGKIGKAVGIAAAAFAALQIVGTIQKSMGPATKTIEDFAQATITSGSSVSNLNAMFRENEVGVEVKGLGEAFLRLNDNMILDNVNNFVGDMFNGTSATQRLRDNMHGLDEQLSILAKGGAGSKAADIFRNIKEETDKTADAQGRSRLTTAELLKQTPEYTKALQAQATALKYKLEGTELEELALGRIPGKMVVLASSEEGAAKMAEIHAAASEEQAKALAEVGLASDGSIASLSKLLDVMFATGLATMSARDAESAYQETLDGLKAKIDEVNASQSAGNAVWDEAKGSFDVTSEAGRSANKVFGDLQQSAINTTTAMANNNATQAELGTKLGETYKSLYDTARAFGASEEKADDLARSALSIPKGVPIDVAIQNYADTLAKAQGIKRALEEIPTRIGTLHILTTDASGFIDPRDMPAHVSSRGTAFANGGMVQAANGLNRQSMIAKGGANILWAEPETGWEAYISGKPGQEDRNRAILTEIAPRFGLEVSQRSREFSSGAMSHGGSTAPASSGDTNVTVLIGGEAIDGRLVRVVRGELGSASRGSSYQRGGH